MAANFEAPEDFLRRQIPSQFDSNGKALSPIECAQLLTPASTPEDVQRILLMIANSSDKLEQDAVLSEIGRATSRKFKVATLRSILSEIRRRSSIRIDAPEWAELITREPDGTPVPIAQNVLVALRNDAAWNGVLAFDEFSQTPMFLKKPPWANGHWNGPTRFTDTDEARTLVWIQECGIHARMEAVRQALSIIIDDNRFHPVRDYLEGLQWDGVSRIDRWLTYYLGVEPIKNYTEVVGARWLISGVARIFDPGCMAKYCLILEGEQDLKKSSALEALGSPWFTDDVAELGTKDSAMQVGNAWIVELPELDSVRRAEINAIKAFISRRTDKFRRPFGRYVSEQPRQCILAGTVNPNGEYLNDDTGAVRFWPVFCTCIDLDALIRDRDQLWAEAVHRYRNGAKWWIEEEESIKAAHEEQAVRSTSDTWRERIDKWLAGNEITKTSVADILTSVFEVALKDHDKPLQTRVGIALRKLGWTVDREVDETGDRVRYYIPTDRWKPKPKG